MYPILVDFWLLLTQLLAFWYTKESHVNNLSGEESSSQKALSLEVY